MRVPVWMIAALASLPGCAPSSGARPGAPVVARTAERPRPPPAYDVALPAGYVVDVVVRDLAAPTGLAFGEHGELYVVESAPSRLVELDHRTGAVTREIALGDHEPWIGLDAQDGMIVVTEGGPHDGGRLLRFDADTGDAQALVRSIADLGEHHTSSPLVVGDWVYFGHGPTVMRVRCTSGEPERVAWGIQDLSGLAATAGGQIFFTERGADTIRKLEPGTEYNGAQAKAPIAQFGVQATVEGLAISASAGFGHVGDAFVALTGDRAPTLARVELDTGAVQDFARRDGRGGEGIGRPIAVRFHDDALYLVDDAGTIWKISREPAAAR